MLTSERTTHPSTASPRWRRPAALVAAAAAVLAIGVGAVVASGGGSTPAKHKTSLALKAPAAVRPGMNACIRFTVDILKQAPVAFAGTVTSATADSVTLDVDRWYKGGTAATVTVTAPVANTAIDGIELVQGKHYLISATDGTVHTCGYSGEATPDLQAAYDQAFTP